MTPSFDIEALKAQAVGRAPLYTGACPAFMSKKGVHDGADMHGFYTLPGMGEQERCDEKMGNINCVEKLGENR